MYAFKVFVSTLIILVILLLSWAGLKSREKSGATIACILMTVNALSLIAIWG